MAKTKTKQTQDPQNFENYVRWFWKLFIGGILAIALLFLLASWDVL